MDAVVSLPPGVKGLVKGHLLCTLANLTWSGPSFPETVHARYHWWGEGTPGLHVRLSVSAVKEITFPICCGPKHLTRYLKDASALVLIIEDLVSAAVLGKVTIHVRHLDVYAPISGNFPILNDTNSKRIGSLYISLAISYNDSISSFEINEHLAAASVPTPQASPAPAATQSQAVALATPTPAGPTAVPLSLQMKLAAPEMATHPPPLLFHGPDHIPDDHLDCLTSIFSSIHRQFEQFCKVYKEWKDDGGADNHDLQGLFQRLQQKRVVPILTPAQQQYLLELLDPLGKLGMDMDYILGALRHASQARLRMECGEIEDCAMQLLQLCTGLQHGMLLLRHSFREAAEGGVKGVMRLQELARRAVDLAGGTTPETLRFLLAVAAHAEPDHLGFATLQGVQKFIRNVQDWNRIQPQSAAVQAQAASPSRLPAAPEAGAVRLQFAALQKLKDIRSRQQHMLTGAGLLAGCIDGAPASDGPSIATLDTANQVRSHLQLTAAPGSMSPTSQQPSSHPAQAQNLAAFGQQPVSSANKPHSLPHDRQLPSQKRRTYVRDEQQPPSYDAQPYAGPAAFKELATRTDPGTLPPHVPSDSENNAESRHVGGASLDDFISRAQALQHSLKHASQQSQESETEPSRASAQQQRDPAFLALPYIDNSHIAADIAGIFPVDDLSDDGLIDDGERYTQPTRMLHHSQDEFAQYSADEDGSDGDAEAWTEAVLLQQLFYPGDNRGNTTATSTARLAESSVALNKRSAPTRHSRHHAAAAAIAQEDTADTDQQHHQQGGLDVPPKHQIKTRSSQQGPSKNPSTSGRVADSDAFVSEPSAAEVFATAAHEVEQVNSASADAAKPLCITILSMNLHLQPHGPVYVRCLCAVFKPTSHTFTADPAATPVAQMQVQCIIPPAAPCMSVSANMHTSTPAGTALVSAMHMGSANSVDSAAATAVAFADEGLHAGLQNAADHHVEHLPVMVCEVRCGPIVPSRSDVQQSTASPAPNPSENGLADTSILLGLVYVPLNLAAVHPISHTPTSSPQDATAKLPAHSVDTLHTKSVPEQTAPGSPGHQHQTRQHQTYGLSDIPAALIQPAVAFGKYDIQDPVSGNTVGSATVLVHPANSSASLEHTFRLTLGTAQGLPDAKLLGSTGFPVPEARYACYYFPGEAEPLCTEDVPCTANPIFAASATHSIALGLGEKPTAELLANGLDNPQLRFEIWDRWGSDLPDTLVASTIKSLAELIAEVTTPTTDAGSVSQILPLALNELSVEYAAITANNNSQESNQQDMTADAIIQRVEARQAAIKGTCLDVHMHHTQTPAIKHGDATIVEHATGADASAEAMNTTVQQLTRTDASSLDTGQHTSTNQDAASGRQQHQARQPSTSPSHQMQVVPPRMRARISVDIVQAVGLQAAVHEASTWLGSGAALLGRAHQVGPHPYVVLALLPGNKKGPVVRTAFQAQAFTPKFNHHQDVEVSLDSHTLQAFLRQPCCIEVWHHSSRAMAALVQQQQEQRLVRGQITRDTLPQTHPQRDVLLGSAALSLQGLLTQPQGLQCWVMLKSSRGEPVGAVQVAMQLAEVGPHVVDTCLAAPAPVQQVPELSHMLAQTGPVAASQLLPTTEERSVFHGQWARCTVYVEQLSLPAVGTAAEMRPRSYKYYVSYQLPGNAVEHETSPKLASSPDSKPAGGSASMVPSNARGWHVAIQHCGVHWVQADGKLAGALLRMPLKLKAWQMHERPTAQHDSRTASSMPWHTSNACLGQLDVDLGQLARAPARGKQPTVRWLSSTYTLVDPTAKCFANTRVRLKILLELSPPSTPPHTALAANPWQPMPELESASLGSTDENGMLEITTAHAAAEDIPQAGMMQQSSPSTIKQDNLQHIVQQGVSLQSLALQETGHATANEDAETFNVHSVQQPSVAVTATTSQPPMSTDVDVLQTAVEPALASAAQEQIAATRTQMDQSAMIQHAASMTNAALPHSHGSPSAGGKQVATAETSTSTPEDTPPRDSPGSRSLKQQLARKLQELELMSVQWMSRLQPEDDPMARTYGYAFDTSATSEHLRHVDNITAEAAVNKTSQPAYLLTAMPAAAAPLTASTLTELNRLSSTQSPAILAGQLTTCSEAGDMVVLGGYSESEANTDELMERLTTPALDADLHSDGAPVGSARPVVLMENIRPTVIGRERLKQVQDAGSEDSLDWMFAFSKPQSQNLQQSPVLATTGAGATQLKAHSHQAEQALATRDEPPQPEPVSKPYAVAQNAQSRRAQDPEQPSTSTNQSSESTPANHTQLLTPLRHIDQSISPASALPAVLVSTPAQPPQTDLDSRLDQLLTDFKQQMAAFSTKIAPHSLADATVQPDSHIESIAAFEQGQHSNQQPMQQTGGHLRETLLQTPNWPQSTTNTTHHASRELLSLPHVSGLHVQRPSSKQVMYPEQSDLLVSANATEVMPTSDANIHIEHVQHAAQPTASRVAFANSLPPIPADFKLEYSDGRLPLQPTLLSRTQIAHELPAGAIMSALPGAGVASSSRPAAAASVHTNYQHDGLSGWTVDDMFSISRH